MREKAIGAALAIIVSALVYTQIWPAVVISEDSTEYHRGDMVLPWVGYPILAINYNGWTQLGTVSACIALLWLS